MSAEKLAEALRTLLDALPSKAIDESGLLNAALRIRDAKAKAHEALVAHSAEQEQAREAVADWSDVRMELEAAGRVDLSVWVERNTRPQQPLSDEQIAVLKFLDGSGLLRGAGYGCLPYGERRPFWWRRQLGDAFPQIRAHCITKDTK